MFISLTFNTDSKRLGWKIKAVVTVQLHKTARFAAKNTDVRFKKLRKYSRPFFAYFTIHFEILKYHMRATSNKGKKSNKKMFHFNRSPTLFGSIVWKWLNMTLEMYKGIRPLKSFMLFLGPQAEFNSAPLLLWGDWRNRSHTNQNVHASQTIGKIWSV